MRDITLIEQVQKKFTKRLCCYRDLFYDERYNLTIFISIQYALIRAISIPTPDHIKNKLTHFLTRLIHNTAEKHTCKDMRTGSDPDLVT